MTRAAVLLFLLLPCVVSFAPALYKPRRMQSSSQLQSSQPAQKVKKRLQPLPLDAEAPDLAETPPKKIALMVEP